MAFTKITGPGIHTLSNIMTHNVKSSGIITAVNGNLSGWLAVGQTASFGGDVSIGGTLTYDDVTNVESVGIITAKAGIHVGAGGTILYALSEDDGAIGLNNTTPSTQYYNNLVVGSNNAGSWGITVRTNSANSGNLAFSDTDSANAGRYDGRISYEHTDQSMRFHTNAEAGGTTERLRITGIGSVGINETSPEELLDLGENNQQNLKVGQRGYLGQAYSTSATILGHSVKAKTTGTTASGMVVTETNSGGGAPSAIRQVSGTIQFHTKTSGTADAAFDSERLRIYGNGAVLIGADSGEAGGEAKLAIDCEGMNIFDGIGDPTNYGLIFANDPTSDKANGIGFFNDSASTCGGYIVHQDRGGGNIGDLLFGTASTSDTPQERLRIASDGRVGMGLTSTSGAKCDPDDNGLLIRHSSTFQTNHGHIMLTGDSSTVGEGPQIVFSESGPGANWAGAYIGHVRKGGGSQGDLVFGTRESTGSSSTVPEERLRIMQDGKVGIGTNDPNDKLSIHSAANTLVLGAKETTTQNHIFQILADDSAGNGELRLYKNSGSGTHQKTVEIASHGNSYFLQGNVGIGTNSISQPLTIRRSSTNQSEFGVRLEYSNLTGPTQTSSAFLVGSYGIKFKNYNSSRNFFFETGDVGIGTDNLDSSATLSICDKTGSSRIYMKSADNADCSIYFGRMSDSATAAIRYDHDVDTLRFYGYNNSQKLYIDNNSVIVAESRLHASRVQAKFGIDCHNLNILDDVNDPSNYGMVFYNDPTTDKANGIGFFNDDGQSCGGYIVHQDKGGSNVGDIIFATSESANTPTERLRLTTKGNVVFKDNHSGHTGGGVYSRTKTVTFSGDNTSSLMRFTLDHGALAGMVFLTASNSGSSVARTYSFALRYGGSPVFNSHSYTGTYSGNGLELHISTNNNQHTFQVEVSGGSQEVNMTVFVGNVNQNITYTEL